MQFVGLTPVENTGQVQLQADDYEEALEALNEYLTEAFGLGNYKIIYFTEATEEELLQKRKSLN